MKTISKNLLISIFAMAALFSAAHGQSVFADADGDGIEVTMVDADGIETTQTVSPGQTFSAPEGLTITKVSGAGSFTLASGASVALTAGTTIEITTSPASGNTGIAATSGTATVVDNVGGSSETITANTDTQFVTISGSGAPSSPTARPTTAPTTTPTQQPAQAATTVPVSPS